MIVVGRPGVSLTEQRRDAARAIHEHAPHRIVLVTDLDQPGPLRRLLNAGVHGLVPSSELNGALGATVRAVATGQLCVSERLRAALIARPLSARERQVLAMVIMGQSNGEIARRLHLAESTVKTHLASMFGKLGVRSRAEAADLVSDPQEMLSTGVLGLRADSAAQREPAR